jgi:DNA-binding protein HU-beta
MRRCTSEVLRSIEKENLNQNATQDSRYESHVSGVNRMNKGQLIEAVAAELGESKATATRAVDAVIQSITAGIKTDEAVTIVGFGTFSKKERAARTGINPATREPMEIKASTTVGFKPSQSLKETL